MAGFICQWTQREFKTQRAAGGNVLCHAASNRFRLTGLEKGDVLFVVAWYGDVLYLMGRLDVDEVLDAAAAAARFRRPLDQFEAFADHAVCAKGDEGYLHFALVVPNAVAAQLRFDNGTLPRLTQTADGPVPNGQTFRSVRALSPNAVETLDALLLEFELSIPD